MKYPELSVTQYKNKITSTQPPDSIDMCVDKTHFKKYHKDVKYSYNSRGFRDNEWPSLIEECIWCVGDSFTVGLGQPFEEIWAKLLESHTDKKTVNISMSGASNDWISRKGIYIIKNIKPKNLVVQWTFLNRKENNDINLSDEERIIHYDEYDFKNLSSTEYFMKNIQNFIKNFKKLNNFNIQTNVVNTFVPNFNIHDVHIKKFGNTNIIEIISNKIFWEYVKNEINTDEYNIVFDNQQLDYSRDGFHYDIRTSENYCKNISNFLID